MRSEKHWVKGKILNEVGLSPRILIQPIETTSNDVIEFSRHKRRTLVNMHIGDYYYLKNA